MNRLALLLPLALAACTSGPEPLPPPDAEVRPVVASDRLDGTWTVRAINGQEAANTSVTLGGDSLTLRLPCNRGSGRFSRNGDKMFVTAPLAVTEMVCLDPGAAAAEEQMLRIVALPMTMELSPPASLRLVNEAGTLDLVRAGS